MYPIPQQNITVVYHRSISKSVNLKVKLKFGKSKKKELEF